MQTIFRGERDYICCNCSCLISEIWE